MHVVYLLLAGFVASLILGDIQTHQKELAEYLAKRKKKVNFYSTWAWRKLRYKVIKHYGRTCMMCNAHGEGVQIQVDHIKPRSLYPEDALDFDNMQILCADCNMGKSNADFTDWR
jgi:5-methylcytosine-specific restriction endonuclease McrA